jgi:hypothetical protein
MAFFGNKNEPFGLPRGSVTAIMVLMFGFAVIFPLIRFSFFHEDIPQSVKEVVMFLAGGLMPVILKYMDSRAKDDELDTLKKRLAEHEIAATTGIPVPPAPEPPSGPA